MTRRPRVRKIKKPSAQMTKAILDHLGLFCPKCGESRDESNINILGKANNGIVVHIACRKCGAQDVFHVVSNVGYSSAGGLVTDISADEAKKFLKAEGVSKDDVLDMHLMLRDSSKAADFVKGLAARRNSKTIRSENIIAPDSPGVSSAV